jgi:two-component system, chemotaxis family, CheB/CheR fusion protein
VVDLVVDLVVEPRLVDDRETGQFVVVLKDHPVTTDAGQPARHDPAAKAAVERLEDELRATRERLETTVEQLETSNEELASSNEELLPMNEELQSSSEELEASDRRQPVAELSRQRPDRPRERAGAVPDPATRSAG